MVAITVSRQYGSGGRKIATQAAQMLNYRFFDKRLMVEVARDVGISENELFDFNEEEYKARGFFDRLLGRSEVVGTVSTRVRDSSGMNQQMVRQLDEEFATDMVRIAVKAAYDRGKVVIVGRGGQHILQNAPDVFHVRIVAPIEVRRQRLIEFEGVRESNSLAVIEERDKANTEYHARFYDTDLDDATHYHLVINSGRWGVDESLQLLLDTYKQFQESLELTLA